MAAGTSSTIIVKRMLNQVSAVGEKITLMRTMWNNLYQYFAYRTNNRPKVGSTIPEGGNIAP